LPTGCSHAMPRGERPASAAGLHAGPTGHDIQQAPGADVDDRRRPSLATARTLTTKRGLIEPQRRRGADAIRVVIDERDAVRDHGVVDRVPVTTQLDSDLVHRAPAPAYLFGRPPPGPVRQRQPRRRNSAHLLGPGPHRTGRVGAQPAPLAPHHRVGRPKHGRSTSSTLARSLIAPPPAHPEHNGRGSRVSMCTRSSPPGPSSTPSTTTEGRPTSSSHTRVGSTSTGLSRTRRPRQTSSSQSACTASGMPYTPLG
jgi:hypothetical protein